MAEHGKDFSQKVAELKKLSNTFTKSIYLFDKQFYQLLYYIVQRAQARVLVPETLVSGYGFSDVTLFAPAYNHGFIRVSDGILNAKLVETFQYFDRFSNLNQPMAIHYNAKEPENIKLIMNIEEAITTWAEYSRQRVDQFMQRYISSQSGSIQAVWENGRITQLCTKGSDFLNKENMVQTKWFNDKVDRLLNQVLRILDYYVVHPIKYKIFQLTANFIEDYDGYLYMTKLKSYKIKSAYSSYSNLPPLTIKPPAMNHNKSYVNNVATKKERRTSHLYKPKFIQHRKSATTFIKPKNVLANNLSHSLLVPKKRLIKKENISKHLGRYKAKRVSLPIPNFDKVSKFQEQSQMNAWWREQEEQGIAIEQEELQKRYREAKDVNFKVHN